MTRTLGLVLACAALVAALPGCVVYETYPGYYYTSPPAPAPRPQPVATFDRAWNAALNALQDNSIGVSAADPATGVIRGTRDLTEVYVTVSRQADGTIQAEIEARSPQGRDSGLASRISAAYQRHMGL